MIAVYSHPDCLGHDPGPGHPEQVARLQVILDLLQASTLPLEWREAPTASRGQLLRAHAPALLRQVLESSVAQGDALALDPDTWLSHGSAAAALRAAGAGVAAVDAVLADQPRRAFCAVRPPGHHAMPGCAMGFCLFNNIAVAGRHALDAHGLARIAIADFDVHHGNGTQAIFEDDPRVLFASSHQLPLYPDSGHVDETGVGNVFNAPLPEGAAGAAFRAAWERRLLPAIDAHRPQLLLVSAGFDAHARDPLAGLRVEAEDFEWLTGQLAALAERHSQGRMVSFLEGGYDLPALAVSTLAHVRALAA